MTPATRVQILRVWDAVPIFHRPGGWWRRATVARHARSFGHRPAYVDAATVCGEPISYRYQPDGIEHERGIAVRLDHALKIGRPCARCWPHGLPEQLTLVGDGS